MSREDPSPLFSRLKSSRRLPTPPGTAIRVLELCRSDDTEVQEIADAIMCDPALSARLLKFANSAAAGLRREVTSVRDAVLLMGLRSVKLSALGFTLASPDLRTPCRGFDLRRFWSASCATAVAARQIAQEHFGAEREEAFTAGLLAGVGRLALAHALPEEYAQVLADEAAGTPLPEAERRVLGVDHAEFGAQVLADWSLPVVLVEAVRCQLGPGLASGRSTALAGAIAAAQRLAPAFVESHLTAEQASSARAAVEESLGLDEAGWQALSERIVDDYQGMASVFDLRLEEGYSAMDLYADAQEEATRVGMVAQLERSRAVRDAEEARRLAATDALTGVANRARFDEALAERVAGLAGGSHFTLILFDIDHFKSFNDTHGHQTGDLVLQRVARAVRNAVPETDLLARYGGEEFAIVSAAADRRSACVLASKVCRCVQTLRVQVGDQELGVTASVGLVTTADYSPAPGAERLVADADAQLYLSKSAGRNAWSYLGRSASMNAAA